ncbi:MAG: hypothetical protein IJ588_09350 [Prevotella sp.]|nr:hypothetical protein [Prevotella sp.]MBR1448931.1 hypothetical protein [Prevotella sp.]
MKPENLETAARMAKKRSELKALLDLLTSYVNQAEVTVCVRLPYATSGDKQACIQSDTFNALMAKLVETEIENIDKFVEQL